MFTRWMLVWTAVLGMLAAIETGKVPPLVKLSEDAGGKADGTAWDSSMLRGKVYVLFYVDPDKKDLNEAFVDVLHKKHYDGKRFGTVAVVNMAATWKPDAIIEMLLEKKQKAYPRTIYVKDKRKVLVNAWKLADDNSDVLIFGKDGKLLYRHFGKMSSDEIAKAIKIIESHL